MHPQNQQPPFQPGLPYISSYVPYTYYPYPQASAYAMQYQQMYGATPASMSAQQPQAPSTSAPVQTYAPERYSNVAYNYLPQPPYITQTSTMYAPALLPSYNQSAVYSTNEASIPQPPLKPAGGLLSLPPPPPTLKPDTQAGQYSRIVLAPKSSSQLKAEPKQEILKAKHNSKTSAEQAKLSIAFNVISAIKAVGSQENVLRKRKRNNKVEKCDHLTTSMGDIAKKQRATNPTTAKVVIEDTPRKAASSSSFSDPPADKFTAFRKSEDTHLLDFPNAQTIINQASNNKTKIDAPLHQIPNLHHQLILVRWPFEEEISVPETRSSPANQSSDEPILRYATPEEMQKLIRSIEEEQWEARAAASYDRPRNPDQCFAESNWHPYRCFICKQTRNNWKEMRNHVEVIHSVIMNDKVRAWECFYPGCNKSFGGRSKGVQHAMAEHWRIALRVYS